MQYMQMELSQLINSYLPMALAVLVCVSTFGNCEKKKTASKKSPSKCEICKELVNTFNKGIDATSKVKHYGGGDTAWEQEKLGSYENSELRLVEITDDNLCHLEDSTTQRKCHHLAEQHEELIEDWWFRQKSEHPDLYIWFCIDQVKVCCVNGTFGPNCEPCKFIKNNVTCSGHGKCLGDGSRDGNGKCKCDKGYKGDACDACKLGYYSAGTDDSKITCESCDPSCAPSSGCHTAGAKGCVTCAPGYEQDEEWGCEDVDECDDTPCAPPQYCSNTPGSHNCIDCAPECATCAGPGPENCLTCATEHIIMDGRCTAQSADNDNPDAAEITEETFVADDSNLSSDEATRDSIQSDGEEVQEAGTSHRQKEL